MIAQALFSFFTDPVLRAPTIGCMLMCLAASLICVIVFLMRESLIGDTSNMVALLVVVTLVLGGSYGCNGFIVGNAGGFCRAPVNPLMVMDGTAGADGLFCGCCADE